MDEERIASLLAEERLPPCYREIVEQVWQPVAERIAERHSAAARPILVGINGAQGTGKSTACHFLVELLSGMGLRTVVLSLDDLYLTRAERRRLAREVHPLLATRGVPGTHDVELGASLIERSLRGTGPVRIPRFSKAEDDRLPEADWLEVAAPIDVLLFEGWCVGATPQDKAALAEPVNTLEADEDADGRWRHYVNDALAGPYRALFDRIDLLVMLRPRGWDSVLANRRLQEEKLRAKGGTRVMDDAALVRFIQHYERLTRHMLATLPAQADVLVDFDADRSVTGIRGV